MTLSLTPLPLSDLPIFEAKTAQYHLFYAPACVVITPPDQAESFSRAILNHDLGGVWAKTLRNHAQQAIIQHQQQATGKFAPECLTLYLHNQCNLACAYCYTDPLHQSAPKLDPQAIESAGELVAQNCQRKNLPFTVVFHGGGEPSLFTNQVDEALNILKTIAQRHGLRMFRYIATNGVMSDDKARWLASRFDLIGLSCDGTPDIHNRQRPLFGGGASSASLERTAHILREMSHPFHVRLTITRDTIHQQSDSVAYICTHLMPDEIHLEPVYMGGKTDTSLAVDEAILFVDGFLEAQAVAHRHGIPVTFSGGRLKDIHGGYCHVFRNVLNIIPDGNITACFKETRGESVNQAGLGMGAWHPQTGIALDTIHIKKIAKKLSDFPSGCADCFNRFHCTRACPDGCALDDTHNPSGTFRCMIQQKLAYHTIFATAEQLWHKSDGRIMGVIL